MNKNLKGIIAKALTTTLVFTLITGIYPSKAQANNLQTDTKLNETKKLGARELDPNEIVRVIVQLKEAPGIESKKDVKKVIAQQAPVRSRVMQMVGTSNIVHEFGYLINGFSLDVKRGEIEALRRLPGVNEVSEVVKYELQMNHATKNNGIDKIWNNMKLKGEGTVVAVIDTGMDVNHKDMKLTNPIKVKLTKENIEKVISSKTLNGGGQYINAKVPYAFNYADDNNRIISPNQHGMHVTGIVAANGSDEEIENKAGIKGVAPEAQILHMRVFGDNGGAQSDTTIRAIEDAVLLGADVINLSLGREIGIVDPNDPQQKAVNKAVEAGVSVVIAAANAFTSFGPVKYKDVVDTGTVGTPSVSEKALSVASCENSIISSNVIEAKVGDKVERFQFFTPDEEQPCVKLTGSYQLVDCGLGYPENFSGKDLNGKIALIKRGIISFEDKVINAQNAGAVGVIFFNSDGNEEVDGYKFLDKANQVKISSVLIRNSDGVKLLNSIKDVQVSFSKDIVEQKNVDSGKMSDFTSWGPTPNLEFKPEVTGVGGRICSTLNRDSYGDMSGTSMASPFVAGVDALVIESLNKNNVTFETPLKKVEFIKNNFISTALPIMDKDHPEVPYSPRRQGAGLVQAKEAIDNKVIVLDKNGKATAALGEIGQQTTFTVTLKNYSDKAATYKATNIGGVLTEDNNTTSFGTMPFDVKIEGASLEFDKQNVTVPANGEATVTVTVKVPQVLKTEQFVEGFIRFESETQNVPSVGIPFMGFYGNWTKPAVFDKPSFDKDSILKRPNIAVLAKAFDKASEVGLPSIINEMDNIEYAPVTVMIPGNTGVGSDGNPIVDANKIAISPNGDARFEQTFIHFNTLRKPGEVKGHIEDANGNIIKHFKTLTVKNLEGTYDYWRKYLFLDELRNGGYDNLFGGSLPDYQWDGKDDKGQVVPQGQYYYKIYSKAYLKDAVEQEPITVPIKVDVTAPTIKLLSPTAVHNKNYELQWKPKDDYSGIASDANCAWDESTREEFTDIFKSITRAQVILNGKHLWDVKVTEKDGIRNCNLQLEEHKRNEIKITTMDNAGNVTTEKFFVSVGNLISVEDAKSNINGNKAEVTFKAVNNDCVRNNVSLIVAAYDGNNKLMNFVSVKENMEPSEIANYSGNIELLPGTKKIKCFVWDSLESMKPLSNTIEINVP